MSDAMDRAVAADELLLIKSSAPTVASKILFVCTYNVVRSICAEQTFRKHGFQWVRSAGVSARNGGGGADDRPVTAELIEWADHIVVFEAGHVDALIDRFGDALRWGKQLTNLRIPDDYTSASDPKLVGLLTGYARLWGGK